MQVLNPSNTVHVGAARSPGLVDPSPPPPNFPVPPFHPIFPVDP